MTTTTPDDLRQVNEALAEAATAATFAPSIHNTQPWHWRVHSGALQLWAVPGRQLPITDPEGRMATISCGAALHHARVALTAQGFLDCVLALPDQAQPNYLAQLTVPGRRPVTAAAMRLYQAISMRHTDRRPVTGEPISQDLLLSITLAVQAYGMYLHILHRDQIVELAAAAAYAQQTEIADDAWRAELAYWAGGSRPLGSGVPDANIPAEPPQTTVPGRNFGHPGTLAVSAAHDTGATYAILYGEQDDRYGWLQAGQALSAGWLTATELGVSVLPLSAVIEVPATRQRLRQMLTEGTFPQLVIRLGSADPEHHGPAATPRLPAERTIDTVEE